MWGPRGRQQRGPIFCTCEAGESFTRDLRPQTLGLSWGRDVGLVEGANYPFAFHDFQDQKFAAIPSGALSCLANSGGFVGSLILAGWPGPVTLWVRCSPWGLVCVPCPSRQADA